MGLLGKFFDKKNPVAPDATAGAEVERDNMEVGMLNRKDDKKPEMENGEMTAFLGKGTEFKGIVTYKGTIRVDGRIEGEIITKGTLVIGESAEIDAKIEAGSVISAGRVNGNISATEKVHLKAPGVVFGSIKCPIIIMEEGVTFNGTCEMKKPENVQKITEHRKESKLELFAENSI